jgi:hypothetical protein
MSINKGKPASGELAGHFEDSAYGPRDHTGSSGIGKAPRVPLFHGQVKSLVGGRYTDDPRTRDYVGGHVDDMARDAFAAQGPRAFESTRRAAACHEAGHAVVGTALGHAITSVRIKRRTVHGHAVWLGLTMGVPAWQVTPDTDPADDFIQGVVEISGIAGELTLDGDDFRQGSSLNEIAIVVAIANNVRIKLKADHADVMGSILKTAFGLINANADAARELARRLERDRRLQGPPLEKMLTNVRRGDVADLRRAIVGGRP